MEIRKKTWPEFFQKVLNGEKNVDLRLADFEINSGDILVLEEYDPRTKKYTGRIIKKEVKRVNRVQIADFNSLKDIEKYGHYLIEF